MTPTEDPDRPLRVGLVSISDRAASGQYEDKGIPSLIEWLTLAIRSPWSPVTRLIADEADRISTTLTELVDVEGCHLVLTTGGTGPAPRDVTPEATLAVADRTSAGIRRTDAPDQSELRADCDPFASGGGDPQAGADHQPPGPAAGDPRDARRPARQRHGPGPRDLRRGALLPRPDRRALRADRRRGLRRPSGRRRRSVRVDRVQARASPGARQSSPNNGPFLPGYEVASSARADARTIRPDRDH